MICSTQPVPTSEATLELDFEKIMVGLRKGKSIFRTSMYELNEKYLGN